MMTEETVLSTVQGASGASSEARVLAHKSRFAQHLRKVLACLYDPTVLRSSPLAELLGVERDPGMASTLRRALLQAIESLRPNENTPPGTKVWRVYQILRRRYTEQLTQREVASALGLSTRQLQREEKLARQVLADYLWATYSLDERAHLLDAATSQAGNAASTSSPAQVLTRTQELLHLRDTLPTQSVDLDQVIREVLETIDPLRESLDVPVAYVADENLPLIRLQAPILREALLNLINIALSYSPRQIELHTRARPRQVSIQVTALPRIATTSADAPGHHPPFAPPGEHTEGLEMARQLVQICQGTLSVSTDADYEPTSGQESVFAAQLTLQAEDRITVLVIDDNEDVLRLFRRYLTGTRYRFVGTQIAQQALALAEDLTQAGAPQIIVLDVMMPKQDGWTLLGQFREHPQLARVPIIVCTILPQEQLALTLGAAEFIRKPVSRSALLTGLDRQVTTATRGAAASR